MTDGFDPYHVWLGIPPDEQPPNHYRLLGLRLFESDGDVISNALDQRLAHLRTLQAGKRAMLSQKLLNEVSAAGTLLLDWKKKQQYDERLKQSQPAIPTPSSQPGASRKTALPTARALAPAEPIAAVVPLPDPVTYTPTMPAASVPQPPAYVVPIPVPVPVHLPQPSPDPTTPAISSASYSASSSTRRRSSGGGLAIAIVALCTLVVGGTVGAVIWTIRRQQQPPVANVSPTDPATITPAVNVPPIPAATTPGSNLPSVAAPAAAPPTGSNAVANDQRQVWVYADNTRGGFRRMPGGNWVELSETSAVWYRQREATAETIVLAQVGGSAATVTLQGDRLLRNDTARTGPTVFFGKWRSIEGLPPFARRDPGNMQPLGPLNPKAIYYGLLFDGQSQLAMPLPEPLKPARAKFTIELMVRWLDPRAEACLLECGDLRLTSTPGSGGHTMLTIESGGKELQFGAPVALGHTLYPTIICDGTAVQVAFNGSPLPPKLPPPTLGQGPILVGRDARGARGFRGLLKGLRISEFDRWTTIRAPTTLARSLIADDLTMAALDMQPPLDDSGDQIALVGTSGGSGKRTSAQWVPMDFLNRLAAEELPIRINLLKSYLAAEHVLAGELFRTASQLDFKSPQGITGLQLPYLPPSRYRLEADVARTGGSGGLVLGLMLDDQPALLLVDADAAGKRVTGFLTAGSSLQAGNPNGITSAPLTSTTKQVTCNVVTDQGRAAVRVQIDGQLVCDWQGEIASIPVPADWPLKAKTMFIGSRDATFQVTRLTLNLQPPGGAIAAGAFPRTTRQPPSSTTPTTPTTTTPMPGVPVGGPPGKRMPPPDAATLATELEKAREIYAERLAKATRPEQKVSLAEEIQQDGNATKGDATARYVLIDLARKVFVQGGAAERALAATALLAQEYDVSETEMTIVTLEGLDGVSMVAKERALHAKTAIALAERLIEDEKTVEASKLAALASQSINRQSDAALKRSIALRSGRIGRIAAGWDAAQTHLATLAEKPDDPAAHLSLGKFYCLVWERWPQGTEHLAKSGEPAFADPARLDLAATDAKGQLAAAEAWLALAAQSHLPTKDEKQAVQRRAKQLLEQALAGLEGLDKVRVQKRLEALGDVGELPPLGDAKTAAPAPAPAPVGAAASEDKGVLLGNVDVNGIDTGVVVMYRPGNSISEAEFSDIITAVGVRQAGINSLRIRFTADLVVKKPGGLTFSHAVSPGAATSLTIGNATSDGRAGDGRTVRGTAKITEGRTALSWELLSKGDFDGAVLTLKPQAGAEAEYELELAASARDYLSRQKPKRVFVIP
jgi:hypothetical protein